MRIPDHIDTIPFFFIIGRPRSGTTLLQTLFEAHPNVQIPPESPVIKESYLRFKHIKHWEDKNIKDFIKFIYTNPKFREWKVEQQKVYSDLLEQKEFLTFNSIIKILYLNYTAVFPKENIVLFGDKNPNYSRNPKKLLEIFPEAKMVHIVRDYRDHILSVKRVKLLNSNLPLIADLWRRSQKRMLRLMKIYPGSIISIKYEDFVQEPDKYLEQMCAFLHIKYSPSMLDYSGKEKDIKEGNMFKASDVFHGNLFRPISSDNAGKWKKEMMEEDIRMADFYVGKYAELSGYNRQFKQRKTVIFFRALPGYLYVFFYHFTNMLIAFIPIKYRKLLRMKILNKKI